MKVADYSLKSEIKKTEKSMLKKIVVIGPESTGKSSLCEALSLHYKTVWCKEYARQYLTEHGTEYSYENLLEVAKGQLANEDKAIDEASRLYERGVADKLIIDTDMYVMKVWCEYVFNNCHPFILEKINERKYDLYLLCDIDLPWKKDEMREYPEEGPRKELFVLYKELLINQNTPWEVVSGIGEERTKNAIRFIDNHCK